MTVDGRRRYGPAVPLDPTRLSSRGLCRQEPSGHTPSRCYPAPPPDDPVCGSCRRTSPTCTRPRHSGGTSPSAALRDPPDAFFWAPAVDHSGPSAIAACWRRHCWRGAVRSRTAPWIRSRAFRRSCHSASGRPFASLPMMPRCAALAQQAVQASDLDAAGISLPWRLAASPEFTADLGQDAPVGLTRSADGFDVPRVRAAPTGFERRSPPVPVRHDRAKHTGANGRSYQPNDGRRLVDS